MDNVASCKVTIVNQLGMHARAAGAFVRHAGAFACEVEIRKGAHTVSGKSIMGILGLAMPMGDTFEIIATGEDADKALDRLRALVADRFGEEV